VQLQKRAMSSDFSWAQSSLRYVAMYNELGHDLRPGNVTV
jgi:glycogen synthase